MVIVNDGLAEIVSAVEALIDSGAYGTGTTTVSETDTTVEGKLNDTDNTVSVSSASGSISVVHTTSSTEGNGSTLGNFGLEDSDTTLLTHNNVTPIVKNSTKEIVTTTTIFVDVN